MIVKDIYSFLNNLYPVNTACDFDNVGLIIGDENQTVDNVLITLDCTIDSIEFAIDNKCSLIITHHPVIFSPVKRIIKNSVIYELISNNISVISMHTNMDIAEKGVNENLAKALSFNNYEKVTAQDGFTLLKCNVDPISPDILAENIKNSLNVKVKYISGNKDISNILICCGSGSNYINDVISCGCDALITGDVKHNHFIDAQNTGISLFDAGHYETENIFISELHKLLKEKFKQLKFITLNNEKLKII